MQELYNYYKKIISNNFWNKSSSNKYSKTLNIYSNSIEWLEIFSKIWLQYYQMMDNNLNKKI